MNTNKNESFVSWFKKHPTKALLYFFVILIPLIVIILLGVNFNRNGKKFYFEKDGDKPIYLYQKDLTSKKGLNKYFDEFEIKLKEVSSATTIIDDEKIEVPYGKFKFEIDYELNSYYKVSRVDFRYVMTANWFNEQSDPTSNSTITFAHNLPNHKYLVLSVKKPILYVEITIIRSSFNPGIPQDEVITLYYKYDLRNVNYDNVKP